MTLPDFKLETHLARWEFAARHHLTASDAESMTLGELLALATAEERAAFEGLWLGYTETRGAPELRAEIAATYTQRTPEDVLCFAGAEEGLYVAMHALLERGDHAVVVTPNYQSAESVPLSRCEVSGVALDREAGWALDIERVEAALRPNTRVVSINFPHNPTGAILARDRFDALIALCRARGVYLFSDEVYRPLGPLGATHLPQVADVYERGLSLNVMSKAWGLPGLRIGWIACADQALLARMERLKHYLSICNAAPAERLAVIALRNRDALLERTCRVVTENLPALEAFFARWPELFAWTPPQGGCIAFPQYRGAEGVEVFTQRLLDERGVLLLPASIYRSALTPTPTDHFRIGFGRRSFGAGLAALEEHLRALQNN